jgi:hypothetical protein
MLRTDLARIALNKALEYRNLANIELTDSFCVHDRVEGLGIREVRFVEIPSLEEWYWKDEEKLIIGSLRPDGRQAFNCAHGFGHHVFGHGMCITSVQDATRDKRIFDPKEYLADMFAAFFLMPKSTVCNGFARRNWSISSATPLQIYEVACWLGVGYGTLIEHMCRSLKLINRTYADRLLKVTPMAIREHILGRKIAQKVILVDTHWTGRPIDLEVGDLIVLRDSLSFDGPGLTPAGICRYGACYEALLPSSSTILTDNESEWCVPVRISRMSYRGMNIFRFEEDPDYEPQTLSFD